MIPCHFNDFDIGVIDPSTAVVVNDDVGLDLKRCIHGLGVAHYCGGCKVGKPWIWMKGEEFFNSESREKSEVGRGGSPRRLFANGVR
jgi:hypothetical protein